MDEIKEKSIAIVLYGPMGVGKLTIGKLLSEKLEIPLSHNHLINDLVHSVFERKSLEAEKMVDKMRLEFYSEVAQSGKSFIITHCYANDFISSTGLSDPEYMLKLEAIFEKAGIDNLFVHLTASDKVLLERVVQPDRKSFRKLTDVALMKENLAKHEFSTPAPVKNNLEIDNSHLSAEETANKIIDFINTKF